MLQRKNLNLLYLLVGTIVLFCVSLAIGSVYIPLNKIVLAVVGMGTGQEIWDQILFEFRLPKSIAALLGGAALGTSGLQMQTFFRNPLAGPYVLGLNSGASLGVALVVLGFGGVLFSSSLGLLGYFGLAGAAALGAAGVMLFILWVSRKIEDSTTLLILGLMFGYITSSLVGVLIYFGNADTVQSYILWTFGSFRNVSLVELKVFSIAVCTGLFFSFLSSKSLNVLMMGPQYAQTMGLNLRQARLGIILNTALLAGAVTAFCGPVGFLGIAVPHLCRAWFRGMDHQTLIPAVALAGGGLALIAEMVSQLPGTEKTLPLNSVTACIGAPVIIWVLVRQGKVKPYLR